MPYILSTFVLFSLLGCATSPKRPEVHLIETHIPNAHADQVRAILSKMMDAQERTLISATSSRLIYSHRHNTYEQSACHDIKQGQIYNIKASSKGVEITSPIYMCSQHNEPISTFEFNKARVKRELTAIKKLWSAKHDLNLESDFNIWENNFNRGRIQ